MIDSIIAKLNLNKSFLDEENFLLLSKLSIDIREQIALKSGMMVLYLGEEVELVQQAEEKSALTALPKNSMPNDLIVANVGAGNRIINNSFIAIDAFRENAPNLSGLDLNFNSSSFLSLLDNLPFKNDTLDAIISIHSLEHIENPVQTILDWLNIIKPGGGIGVILPNYNYTWSARNDLSQFGHKWDPYPELIQKWHEKYWSGICALEKFNSLPYKLSFDFVLRKFGSHTPFQNLMKIPCSGFELNSIGRFANDIF